MAKHRSRWTQKSLTPDDIGPVGTMYLIHLTRNGKKIPAVRALVTDNTVFQGSSMHPGLRLVDEDARRIPTFLDELMLYAFHEGSEDSGETDDSGDEPTTAVYRWRIDSRPHCGVHEDCRAEPRLGRACYRKNGIVSAT